MQCELELSLRKDTKGEGKALNGEEGRDSVELE